MWKKDENPEPMAAPRPETVGSYDRVAPPKASGERATIGRSITIKGEVTGDEDLLVQGRVDGSITLKQHAVTVGPEGEVKADIGARIITVEGSVEGNLSAQEQIILRGSALVQGNIKAPRVVLEDGARFRGGVDMGEAVSEVAPLQKSGSGANRPVASSPKTSGELNANGAIDKPIGTPAGAKDATTSTAAAPISR